MSLKPVSIPTKTLAASITALSTSFKLNNILGWNGSVLTSGDFGTQAYCVFRNANRSRIEIMEFDPATVANTSITILRRGLSFDGDLTTEVTANKFAWTKGDTFVDMGTDAPQVFQWLKEYIDAAAISGGVPASTTVSGIVEEATQAEADAGTAVGATGARLFINPAALPTPKRCHVYQTGATNLATVTNWYVLSFGAELFDTDTMHDNSTNPSRITFTTAGTYLVGCNVTTPGNNYGVGVKMVLNGTTDIAFSGPSEGAGTDNGISLTTLYSFTAGQYVEFSAKTNGGNNYDTSGNLETHAWAIKIA